MVQLKEYLRLIPCKTVSLRLIFGRALHSSNMTFEGRLDYENSKVYRMFKVNAQEIRYYVCLNFATFILGRSVFEYTECVENEVR